MNRYQELRNREIITNRANAVELANIVRELGCAQDEDHELYMNIDLLLDAWRDNRLTVAYHELPYGSSQELVVTEEDRMLYCRGAIHENPMFYAQLPAFCVLTEDREGIAFVWVHRRARRLGIATAIVEKSNATYAHSRYASLEERGFWASTTLKMVD